MSLIDALLRRGRLRTVDHALAQSLRRLDPATQELVLAGAALASRAIADGHAAFDPELPGEEVADIVLVEPRQWSAARAS